MTNAELIQKIRAEIKRRINRIEDSLFIHDFDTERIKEGEIIAYKEILHFLDYLERQVYKIEKFEPNIHGGVESIDIWALMDKINEIIDRLNTR